MAIQSQLYSENFGFGLGERGVVSQDYVENGFGVNGQFYLNLQQKQQHQQQQYMEFQQQQQQQQFLQQKSGNFCIGKSALVSTNNNPSVNISQSIMAQMEKQRQEMDQFISVQNERLRLALLEQRKQQLATILRKYEARAGVLLRQKDEEIAKALNKKMELENMIRGMEIENQTWQRMAKENEAIVLSLNNTIEQLKQGSVCLSLNNGGGVVEDAESCCEENNRGDSQENNQNMMMCRSCNSWNSCVVFLPCRHLCSCKACEAFIHACPVCGMEKKSSIEALF